MAQRDLRFTTSLLSSWDINCFFTEYYGTYIMPLEPNKQKTEKLIQINRGTNKNFRKSKGYDFIETTRNYEFLQDSYESSGDFMREAQVSHIDPNFMLHKIEIIDNEPEKSKFSNEKHSQDLKLSETANFFERHADDYILQSLFEDSENENNNFGFSESQSNELAHENMKIKPNKDNVNISLKDDLEYYIGKLLMDYDSTETETTNSLNQAKNEVAVSLPEGNAFNENTKQKQEDNFSDENHNYFDYLQSSAESEEFFVTNEDEGDYLQVESDIQSPELKEISLTDFFNSFLRQMPSILGSGSSQELTPLTNYFSSLPTQNLNGDVLRTEASNIQPQWKPNIIKDSNKFFSGLNFQNWFPKTDNNVLHSFHKPINVFSKIFHSENL